MVTRRRQKESVVVQRESVQRSGGVRAALYPAGIQLDPALNTC